jgi:hypothetical protein
MNLDPFHYAQNKTLRRCHDLGLGKDLTHKNACHKEKDLLNGLYKNKKLLFIKRWYLESKKVS